MSEKLGTVQYEGNHQVFVGRDYGQTKAYSEDIAYQIDSEVRRMMSEAHIRARQIIEEHREQLNLIAEKLLELETLDEKTIRSLFETGQMPSDSNAEEYPSEKAQSFEEAKRALEKKEAEKIRQEERALADGETEDSTDFSAPAADETAENEDTETE